MKGEKADTIAALRGHRGAQSPSESKLSTDPYSRRGRAALQLGPRERESRNTWPSAPYLGSVVSTPHAHVTRGPRLEFLKAQFFLC